MFTNWNIWFGAMLLNGKSTSDNKQNILQQAIGTCFAHRLAIFLEIFEHAAFVNWTPRGI